MTEKELGLATRRSGLPEGGSAAVPDDTNVES